MFTTFIFRCTTAFSTLLILASTAGAQTPFHGPEYYVKKDLVIVGSTRSYRQARQIANAAAQNLSMPLDLRGLSPNGQLGLSFSKHVCNEEFYGYPCYLARGRYDDGAYVSIEYSSSYETLRPGYYIVVIASAVSGDTITKRAAQLARSVYVDAYTRRVDVYMGCIH